MMGKLENAFERLLNSKVTERRDLTVLSNNTFCNTL